jgi:NAD(P)-dependent dehydrogenase (short-subunit alcohol dehydrogenase family)
MPTLLLTGANRGIGLELMKQFTPLGWTIHATCRDPASATDLRQIADEAKGRVTIHRLEATDHSQIEALGKTLSAVPIDILFNNAGVMEAKQRSYNDMAGTQTIDTLDWDDWMGVMRINVMAPARMSEVFADHVAKSERKVIAFVSSVMGSIAMTTGTWIHYRASKTAVNMMMRSMAADLRGRGITTVSIHPGWVRTSMGGPTAAVAPEDSAAGICRVVTGVTPAQNGHFLTFDGKELPW